MFLSFRLSDQMSVHLFIYHLNFVLKKVCVRFAFLFIYQLTFALTLKTPRKSTFENIVCLCRLLNILANFSNLFLHTGKQCGPRSDCS